MPKRVVTPLWRENIWKVRIAGPDGRAWYDLPGIPCDNEPLAIAVAQALAKKVRAGGGVTDEAGETVAQYIDRWLDSRSHQKSSKVRRYELVHVANVIGALPIAAVTRGNMEDVVTALDKQVRVKEFGDKYAKNVWGTLRTMMADASKAKDRSMRVRADDPTQGVSPPDIGAKRMRQFLYPNEFLQLMKSSTVPLRWRRMYAISVYAGMRIGELAALGESGWAHVDLQHRILTITESMDRNHEFGKVGPTKTGRGRRASIESNLIPLLEHMKRNGDPFVVVPRVRRMAERFRDYLKRAGIKRAGLLDGSATVAPITHHDLRATYLTWQALRGMSPLAIQGRAGHSAFATTQIYIREAEIMDGATFGEVFPDLPSELFGLGSGFQARKGGKSPVKLAPEVGLEDTAKAHEKPTLAGELRAAAQSVGAGSSLLASAVADAVRAAAAAGDWDAVVAIAKAARGES